MSMAPSQLWKPFLQASFWIRFGPQTRAYTYVPVCRSPPQVPGAQQPLSQTSGHRPANAEHKVGATASRRHTADTTTPATPGGGEKAKNIVSDVVSADDTAQMHEGDHRDSERSRPPCKFWITQKRCRKGDSCPFEHCDPDDWLRLHHEERRQRQDVCRALGLADL